MPGTSVRAVILENVGKKKQHFTLIDPEKVSLERALHIAGIAQWAGSDAILVGGSTSLDPKHFETTLAKIAELVDIPVIQFPHDSRYVSTASDALFFLCMLNSRDKRFIVGEPMKACRTIQSGSIETIAVGYVVCGEGMKVGSVGQAELLDYSNIDGFVDYGLLAQHMGMDMVYFESGSGAPASVPSGVIGIVRGQINIPIIVGGGIMESETAENLVKAGADIIVTGTLVESENGVEEKLADMIKAISKVPQRAL